MVDGRYLILQDGPGLGVCPGTAKDNDAASCVSFGPAMDVFKAGF